MKKITTLIICAIALLAACENEGSTKTAQEQALNRVITLPDGGMTESTTVLFALGIGHRASDCNGCVYSSGKTFHIDCQGHGNYCATATLVQLQEVGTSITATTVDTFDLTSEDFFNMPARSLNYTKEDNSRVYLNIPAQLVLRDTATLQFTFTGLYITEEPEFENN